jgi:hypothetical protein
MASALSLLIRSDFQLISANIHTAPPARSLLARIEEVNDAQFALAKAGSFGFREKICRSIND